MRWDQRAVVGALFWDLDLDLEGPWHDGGGEMTGTLKTQFIIVVPLFSEIVPLSLPFPLSALQCQPPTRTYTSKCRFYSNITPLLTCP